MIQQVDEEASWQNCKLTKLEVDETESWWAASWWNSKLMKY